MLAVFLLPLLVASQRHHRENQATALDAEYTIDEAKEIVADIKLKTSISSRLKRVLKEMGITKDLLRILNLAPKLYIQADRLEKDAKRTLRQLAARRKGPQAQARPASPPK